MNSCGCIYVQERIWGVTQNAGLNSLLFRRYGNTWDVQHLIVWYPLYSFMSESSECAGLPVNHQGFGLLGNKCQQPQISEEQSSGCLIFNRETGEREIRFAILFQKETLLERKAEFLQKDMNLKLMSVPSGLLCLSIPANY